MLMMVGYFKLLSFVIDFHPPMAPQISSTDARCLNTFPRVFAFLGRSHKTDCQNLTCILPLPRSVFLSSSSPIASPNSNEHTHPGAKQQKHQNATIFKETSYTGKANHRISPFCCCCCCCCCCHYCCCCYCSCNYL